jgi:hypothetical protein
MKSFWAISRIRCLYEADVSRTISIIIIIRDLMMMMMMMMTEMVIETSVSYRHLTQLIAQKISSNLVATKAQEVHE